MVVVEALVICCPALRLGFEALVANDVSEDVPEVVEGAVEILFEVGVVVESVHLWCNIFHGLASQSLVFERQFKYTIYIYIYINIDR